MAAVSDESIGDFIAFTGGSADEARQFIEMAGGNVQDAVNLFIETGGGGGGGGGAPPNAGGSPMPYIPPDTAGQGVGQGGIVDADVAAEVAAVAAAAGLGAGDSPMGEEEVRAPIQAFQDQIINPDMERRRMQEAIAADQEAMGRRMSFDRPEESAGAGGGGDVPGAAPASAPAGQAINQLFAAPSFNSALPWYEAVTQAKEKGQMVLVNIQQAEVFASHTLNRDVWSDETIRDIIDGSFMFWQRDDKSTEGQQFCSYYNCGHQLPHICVVDPRTGRRVKGWEGRKWCEPHVAAEYLFAFLEQHSMSKSPMMSPESSPAAAPGQQPQEVPPLRPGGGLEEPAMSDAVDDVAMESEPAEPIALMPEEPPEGTQGSLRVSLRLPDGRRIMRRFGPSDTLAVMFAVVSATVEQPVSKIDLAMQFPNRALRDVEGGFDAKLQDLQVAGSMVLANVRSS